MAEASASSSPDPPFSQSFSEDVSGDRRDEPGSYTQGPNEGLSEVSFALSAAKHWVREHQKASMLGALAVGVFVGALLRE